jgi:NHLM bacteriocin system ABC transporter ATP-binding protein
MNRDIYESAEVFKAHQWIPLDSSDLMYVVEDGAVDLFMRHAVNGQQGGPLYHISRVEKGHAFCCFEDAYEGASVIGIPAPDAILHPRRIWECIDDEASVAYLESWIATITSAARRPISLAAAITLNVGDIYRATAQERIVPRDEVQWMMLLSGTVTGFCGHDTTNENCFRTWFPIAREGWLDIQPGTCLRTASTRDLIEMDGRLGGFRDFQRLSLRCLAHRRRELEREETARLEAKRASTTASFKSALTWLARTIENQDSTSPDGLTNADPVFLACCSAAKAQGIELKVPRDVTTCERSDLVLAIARQSSIRVRRVLLDGNWWRNSGMALIAFCDDNRPVALLPRSEGYTMYDPTRDQRRRIDSPRIASRIAPVAYCFYRPFPDKPLRLRDVLLFGLKECRRLVALVVSMGLVSGLLSLAVPVGMGVLVESAIPSAQRNHVLILGGLLLAAVTAGALVSITRNLAVLRLQATIDCALQSAAWDRILRLPAYFFREFGSGDLAVRSLAFNEIGQALAGPVLSLIVSHAFSLVSIVVLFLYSWRLAMFAFGLFLIAGLVSGTCIWIHLKNARELARLRGLVIGTGVELALGVPKFRVSGSEERVFAAWALLAGARRRAMARTRTSVIALLSFSASWPILCMSLILWAATASLGPHAMSAGDFLAFMTIFSQVISSALSFAVGLIPVFGLVPLYERTKPILECELEVRRGMVTPGRFKGSIEVSHVTFRYGKDQPEVLKDVSFSARPGEMVAIVGSSGSGKSSLFRILLGFERPESGGIYYDGQLLSRLDVENVRRQLGVVLQNGRLSSGTILNLIVGTSQSTVEDAWNAARLVGLDRDIAAMPMEMQTVIGDGGLTLSGGQRQRLMIAAAIVGRPRIILFDEATSALDNETQSIVTSSIEQLNATRLVIAHRLSTIIRADSILVLDKGTIVDQGSYDELMSRAGLFREFAARQLV